MPKTEITYLSGYRILWMLVMFDLPTDTKKERKAATKFREFLLNEGFERSQFSVYARFVNGLESYEARTRRIEKNLPIWGDVQILHFTDKQYEMICHFSNRKKTKKEKIEQLVLF